METITYIASQTNLLTLIAAAIEASRDVEHDRGFSVVADDERKANQTFTSSLKYAKDIITIQTEILNAVQNMESDVYRNSNDVRKFGEVTGPR